MSNNDNIYHFLGQLQMAITMIIRKNSHEAQTDTFKDIAFLEVFFNGRWKELQAIFGMDTD